MHELGLPLFYFLIFFMIHLSPVFTYIHLLLEPYLLMPVLNLLPVPSPTAICILLILCDENLA